MKETKGTLYFFCGKMGAGKSTRSRQLAAAENAVLISEDDWLSALYPGQINNFADYRQYSTRLAALIDAHVIQLLETGTKVVLDFPGNTIRQRRRLAGLAEAAGASSLLIYLQASDATCLEQISRRRIEQPERARFDTEAVFAEVTSYFQEPTESEGLDIRLVECDLP